MTRLRISLNRFDCSAPSNVVSISSLTRSNLLVRPLTRSPEPVLQTDVPGGLRVALAAPAGGRGAPPRGRGGLPRGGAVQRPAAEL